MVAEDGQGVGDPVAQVGPVVVAVQLDVLQAGLGQASGAHLEGLLPEPQLDQDIVRRRWSRSG